MLVKKLLLPITTAIGLIVVTVILVFLARGYSFDFQKKTVTETGLLLVNSIPDAGLVFIDNKPTSLATNGSVSLVPNEYHLKIQKPGFFTYLKTVKIEKELITRVDALLIPIFPELKPLSLTGAKNPVISPDGTKIVFATEADPEKGLWILDLNEKPFGLTTRPSRILADDTVSTKEDTGFLYSQAIVSFSFDSKKVLLENVPSSNPLGKTANFLLDLQSHAKEIVSDVNTVKNLWLKEKQLNQEKLGEGLAPSLTERIAGLLDLSFSPDGNWILYQTQNGQSKEFKILKIKETINNKKLPAEETILVTANFASLFWFPDSTHLLILEKKPANDKQGTISLLELNRENKTKIFEGIVLGQTIFPYPSGSRIAILTNFSPESNQTNLYSINLR